MPDLVEFSSSQPVTLVFAGRLRPESFAGFLAHRAGRLALPYRLESLDSARAVVTVAGQPDLVDAFEIACSLGPADCLVLDSRRAPTAGPKGTPR